MRGAVVYAIAAEEFGRKLSLLSRLYGGRVVALDGAGRLLASTDGEALLTDEELGSLARPVVSSGGERFRVYTRNSAYNDWRYVAVISEKRITAAAIRTRNTAFVLLGAGFLIALGISYAVASSNTRPLSRIFALLLPPQEATLTRASGVYARVEDAILALSDSKRQLESEASSAASVVRTYFLQKLLRGEYRSRQPFAEDRSRFSVPLSSGPYFVLSCRLSSLAAALDGDERGEALAELQRACSALVSEDEHAVGVSAGEVAVLLRAGDDYRSVASDIVERVRSRLTEGRRDGVVFGVGTPVDDPFLLPISYGEAEAAVSAAGPELRKPMRLYEDLPSSEGTYRYPLDVEEAIVKAVRSANTLLLDSLMDGVREANFVARALHPSEAEKLVSALKGTVYRLLSELPEAGRAASASEPAGKESLRSIVDRLDSSESVEDAFAAVSAALHSLAEERDRGKRSHNATLAAAVRDYVASRFRDFNLSLSSVADVFDLSENYLSSFFKEQEGESLSEYIQRKRMSEASKLLSEATASVDAIAANCGYPNVASFRRAFKRVYGVSPSEYRNGRTAERGQL
jgi:AraC-like DNA-binding protein